MHAQNTVFITQRREQFTRSSGGHSVGPCTHSTSAWRPGRKGTRLGRVWTPWKGTTQNLHPAKPHPKIIGKGAFPIGKGPPNIGIPDPGEDQPWNTQKSFLLPLTSARALCDWKNTASLWPHLGGQSAIQPTIPFPPPFIR